jgi:NAD(P)-dependent dehydrogenase (short-subunit alcohol dehydrogenase family)
VGVDRFRYDGKRVLVVGGASGMGEAAARLVKELGGAATVMDVKEPTDPQDTFIAVDLRDRASIDTALERVRGPLNALLSCAGVADGAPGLPQVNFIGQRHLIESALGRGLLPAGAAIAMISSIGGAAWQQNLDVIREFLDTPDFDTASKWIETHPERATYTFTKEAMIAYCATRAPALIRHGIRINCIAPGPTMTPLMAAHDIWQGFEAGFREAMGKAGATPEEQAYPLVFLASDAASFVSGTCLVVDAGFIEGGTVGAVDSPILQALLPQLQAH